VSPFSAARQTDVRNLPRHWLIWISPLVLVALVLLLGVAGGSWLESSGGRQLLQRELSKSLGLPVRLTGNYSLELLPRLAIAGNGLEIGRQGSAGVMAFSKDYSAVIELAPFFHRELRITSIGLHGGFLDVSQVPKATAAESAPVHPEIALPEVGVLEIGDFSIRLEQAGSSLEIRQLRLAGFQPGRAALLEINAGLFQGQEEIARASMNAGLTLPASGLSARLSVHKLNLSWGETTLAGLSGDWEWDQPAAHLLGHMAWDQTPHAADLQLDSLMSPLPSGSLKVRYRQPELAQPATLEIDFSVTPDGVALKHLETEIAGQSFGGEGCILWAEKPRLNLSLHADALDLDKLYSIFSAPGNESAELPFEPAVRVHAVNARFSGAEASDVNLAVGPEPDCGAIAQANR